MKINISELMDERRRSKSGQLNVKRYMLRLRQKSGKFMRYDSSNLHKKAKEIIWVKNQNQNKKTDFNI